MGLRALPPSLLVLALGIVGALALLQALVVAWRKWWRRRKILGRVARAGQGEARARGFLGELGFEILGAQVATTYPVFIDETEVTIALRADYLVEKNGRRYVVEVKTGKLATRIDTAATRRQLLEYRVAFDVDGVLLIDADSEKMHAVTFPVSNAPAESKRGAWGWLALAAALLVAALAAQYS